MPLESRLISQPTKGEHQINLDFTGILTIHETRRWPDGCLQGDSPWNSA